MAQAVAHLIGSEEVPGPSPGASFHANHEACNSTEKAHIQASLMCAFFVLLYDDDRDRDEANEVSVIEVMPRDAPGST